MISEFTNNLIELIRQNGPRSVFWAGVIEQVISPIPSVLIPTSAGFLLIPQNLSLGTALLKIFREISLPYAFGATLGTTVLYLGAFYGGRALIERFGKFFGISLKHIDKFRNKFTKGFRDELIIFGLIALPATPISLMAAGCGLIGIRAFEFYFLVFAGTLIRSLFLGWLGWQAGEAYELAGSGLGKMESLLTMIIAVVGVLGIGFLYYKRHKVLKN